ncbi:MAG TPA: metal ABC transporter ATP-binding protein [Actinomycetota bacterium]|nr:metal ABC transporter ATP-binding protein [Actinomycetota bacterium]
MAAPDRSPAAPLPSGSTQPLVQAEGVSYSYGAGRVVVDVDLAVRPGEFVALVGPNGSGKSTLLRLLLGTLRPASGRVLLFGRPPELVRDRWRVGYVPQRPVLTSEVPATVREIVSTGRLAQRGWWRPLGKTDHRAVNHALESVGLTGLADRPLNELSGGQQQRAFIARAFASEPELLILDEPISGVDAESQRRFRSSLVHLIEEHRGAVLLVSHELSAVSRDLDRVVVLKGRVLFDGPPAGLTAEGVSLGIHQEDLPLWLEDLG